MLTETIIFNAKKTAEMPSFHYTDAPHDEKFSPAFFRKAWWRVNVVMLSSVSDATLMLDFCEVQHLKLNRRVALVAPAGAKLSYAVLICEANMFFFCGLLLKKNGNNFLT